MSWLLTEYEIRISFVQS